MWLASVGLLWNLSNRGSKFLKRTLIQTVRLETFASVDVFKSPLDANLLIECGKLSDAHVFD